jgi:regulator of PEP synthase PpsR (kinase-PPPase family)
VFIVSGGMGSSGEQLARTALAQFEDADVAVTVVPGVRSDDELRTAVEQAVSCGGLILHTLVDASLRSRLVELARELGAAELDLIGTLLEHLAATLGQPALGAPGRYRALRADYFKRVEAIEFAVAHDDGRNCHELGLADVVITGVSRAGKTPLCMYLAMHGFKAANVPLGATFPAPRQILEVDGRRVVGLTLDPDRLVAYRRRRQRDLGGTAPTAYSDPKEIVRDLESAHELFRKHRFATIDVTLRPIEETAREVISLIPSSR